MMERLFDKLDEADQREDGPGRSDWVSVTLRFSSRFSV